MNFCLGVEFDEETNLETIKSYAFSSCSDLDKLFIPKSVGKIEKNVFNGCIGMTIYCEVLDKPTGWVENWSGYSANVIWNTSYQDFYK